jgi:hypothetical protein
MVEVENEELENEKIVGVLTDAENEVGKEVVGEEVETEEVERERRAMRKASAWYYCAYSQPIEYDYNNRSNILVPLVSFPWVVSNVLCRVKQSWSNKSS